MDRESIKDESRIPLRYHLIYIGGFPSSRSHLMVRLDPIKIYAGDPILTVLSPWLMESGREMFGPLSIFGGIPV